MGFVDMRSVFSGPGKAPRKPITYEEAKAQMIAKGMSEGAFNEWWSSTHEKLPPVNTVTDVSKPKRDLSTSPRDAKAQQNQITDQPTRKRNQQALTSGYMPDSFRGGGQPNMLNAAQAEGNAREARGKRVAPKKEGRSLIGQGPSVSYGPQVVTGSGNITTPDQVRRGGATAQNWNDLLNPATPSGGRIRGVEDDKYASMKSAKALARIQAETKKMNDADARLSSQGKKGEAVLNSKGRPKFTSFVLPPATAQQAVAPRAFTTAMGKNTSRVSGTSRQDLINSRNPNYQREQQLQNGGLIGAYENAYGEAKNANEDRWLALLDQYNKFREDATKREGLNLDLLKTQKKQNMKDLNQGYRNLGSQNDQRMVNSGLYNSTIATTLAAGNEKQRAAAMNRLYDDYTAQELGVRDRYNSTVNGIDKDYMSFLERRDDPYPDLNRYTQLAGAMGSTGAAGSGAGGGYGAYGAAGAGSAGVNRYGAGGAGVASPSLVSPVGYKANGGQPQQYDYIDTLRKQAQAKQEAAFYAKNPLPPQGPVDPGAIRPYPGGPLGSGGTTIPPRGLQPLAPPPSPRRKPTIMRF